jgi:antirestriction protein ArdC
MTINTDHTQDLTDKINESITALCAETDAAKQNETYRAWLHTLSRFYSYSFNNWLLIYTQRPDATRVAGFQTWKSLGRFVKKGERGIRIFAPIIRKVEDEKNGATEQVSRPVGFRAMAVFALEQTDGEPLPEIDSNATEGGEELLPRLEAATASLGVQLVYKAIPGAAEGLSKGGLIEIEETLSTAARCGVIAHELAHELQHKQDRKESTRQQRELEAESVSYAVLAHYSIRTESRFYLASYDVTAEMLTASLQTISQTAKRIISAIEGDRKRIEYEPENFAPSSIATYPIASEQADT